MCRVSSFRRIPSCSIRSRHSGTSGRLRRSFAGWCARSPCLLAQEATADLPIDRPRGDDAARDARERGY